MAVKTYYAAAGSGSGSGTQTDPWQHYSEFTGLASGDIVYCSGKFRETLAPVDGVKYKQWPGMPTWITDSSDVFSSWTGPDANGEYYTPASDDPNVVFRNDVKLTEGTLGSLGSDEWAWDGTNSRIYLGFDPTGYTIEAAVRGKGVNGFNKNNWTLKGCIVRRSRNFNVYAGGTNSSSTVMINNVKSHDAGNGGFSCPMGTSYHGKVIFNCCTDYGSRRMFDFYQIANLEIEIIDCLSSGAGAEGFYSGEMIGGSITCYNCRVENSGASGFYLYKPSAGNAVFRNCDSSDSVYGLVISLQSGGTITIENCTAKDSSSYGVYVTSQSGGTCLVDGNEMDGAGSCGIYCTNVTGGTLKVQRNEVVDPGNIGYYFNSVDGGACSFFVSSNIGKVTTSQNGMRLAYGSLGSVYRNTLVGPGSSNTGLGIINQSGCVLKGNIVVDWGSQGLFNETGVTSTWDYNCVYNCGNYGFWNYTTYQTLSAWQTATSQDANSISADPLFVADTYDAFHLTENSPCIDQGTTMTGAPDTDKDGKPALQGSNPDIGCYEFQPTFVKDHPQGLSPSYSAELDLSPNLEAEE
jgi:hypothetical protein